VRRVTDWPYLTVFPQLHPSMQSWDSMKLAVDRIVQDVASRSKVVNGKWKIVGTGMGLGAAGIVHFASKDPDQWSSACRRLPGELAGGDGERAEVSDPVLETGRERDAALCAAVGNPVQ
jgi:hypothetical protein